MKQIIKNGAYTALVTPFNRKGEINYASLKKLIDYQIASGISGLVIMGTTGETPTLSASERRQLATFAIKYINKRVPVIIGAGTNSTRETLENVQLYESLGADGVLIVTPFYNKCTQLGLIEHYTKIANATNLPIILYNVPSRTCVNLEPQTVSELSKIKNIIGIKEASGNITKIMEIKMLTNEQFMIFSGDDALTHAVLAIGGNGVISVLSNLLPLKMEQICREYFAGNPHKARKIQFDLMPYIKALAIDINPIPIKHIMNFFKFNVGMPRLPLTPLTQKNATILQNSYSSINEYDFLTNQ